MSKREIISLLRPRKFRPFHLRLVDGRSVAVPHPEFTSLSANQQSLVIFAPAGGIAKIIDIVLIVSADFEPATASS